MEDPADIDMRCSVIAFKGDSVLLVHRLRDGADDWVLPGGTPRPGEHDFLRPAGNSRRDRPAGRPRQGRVRPRGAGTRRPQAHRGPGVPCRVPGPWRARTAEEGLDAQFVPLNALPQLTLRPPIAGHLRALHTRGPARTAAYLGNLWRPEDTDGASLVPEVSWRELATTRSCCCGGR